MHSTRKNASEKDAKKITPPFIGQLEKRTSFAPPMLFSIELWRQWQPLTFPPIRASDRALRSVEHERRHVVIRVRGCRMTKTQQQL